MAATWTRSAERYENGLLRQIGDRFTFASLGADAVRALGPIESAARAATGAQDFRASLGGVATQARSRFESTPFSIEYGVTSRLAVGAVVPFVTSIVRVDPAVNAAKGIANMGLNPARGSAAVVQANGALLSQIDAASAFLSQRIAACAAAPASAGCAPIVAATASANALLAESATFANALAALYGGRAGSSGAVFIPLTGSAAQAAVAARLAGLKAQYAAYGASQIAAGAPAGAPAPITGAQFQAILTDSAYGIVASPLASVVRRGVGDIDFTLQYTWHDSYAAPRDGARLRETIWWRSAVGGAFRMGAGAAAQAADLIPVPKGDKQHDIELRSITDVGVGAHFSLTTMVQFTRQNPGELSVRVPDSPRDPFPEAFRTMTVTRDPGDEIRLDLFPRWTASEAISIAAHYGYRRKGTDAWSGIMATTGLDGRPIQLDASVLDAGTVEREHRFGATLAYSTVPAWERGRARWPIEVAVSHFQTTAGSGGSVPKLTHDDVVIRWYWRALGRSDARR